MKWGVSLWAALASMFLGWYGLAIIGGGVVLMIIYFFINCWYSDWKWEKHRKERGF